jgi:thiol-disulfide isomerase/thioredoxin
LPFPPLRGLALALFALLAATVTAPDAHAEEPTEQGEARRATLVQYEAGQTDLAALAAGEGKTVVFFFASWCPNCILTLTELSEKWSDVSPDITLVIADYDTETELKARYGVTYQDTFVLLDDRADGVKLWNAGGVAGLNDNTR